MFTLKATVLLGAPLLAAAASEVIPSRIQRRAALLELLEHQNERRQADETYGQPDICNPDAGTNDASFLPLPAGGRFPGTVYPFEYTSADSACVTDNNCQQACIADATTCVGYVYGQGSAGAAPTCTLYGGPSYGGSPISNVPANFNLLQNAGSAENPGVATCASKSTGRAALDSVDPVSGACTCAPGRRPGDSGFTCESDAVPAGAYTPPKTLEKPVNFVSKITWDYGIEAVPAVMTSTQCAAICNADSNCEAYLLRNGSELSTCWKIGADGVYDSPADGFPFTASGASRKRAAGQAGAVGGAGDVFGQATDSNLINDADEPTPSAGARMRMRVKRAHSHVQW